MDNCELRIDNESQNTPADFSRFKLWWLAARPKTLTITIAPILCASVLAYDYSHSIDTLVLVAILVSALFIQIGTNLYNDAADFERGADNSSRLGPDRVTAQGWLTAGTVKQGALFCFFMAFIAGIYLAYIGGWPIILLGLVSIGCGYAYTGGPKPIAYSPLGELFVILFFGLAAMGGTFYLLSQTIEAQVFGVGLALGCFAAAILLVNNYRDLDNDVKVDKITLAFYLGRKNSLRFYTGLLFFPYAMLLLLFFLNKINLVSLLLTTFSIIYAITLIRHLYRCPISKELNLILVKTAKLQLLYSLLFASGFLFKALP